MSASGFVTLSSTAAKFPLVGLGTWKAAPGVVREVVYQAIKVGYRHLDCACDYGNEQEVGQGIAKAISEGIISRQELFVTSKLWNTYHAKEHVEMACRKTLADLGLDYLDLYLIHFPISLKFVPFEVRYPPEWIHDPNAETPKMELADIPIRETWEAMEELVSKGLVKNIGVSNFNAQSIMDLMKYAKVKPAVNQVEIHPYLNQSALIEYCQSLGIQVTGYSNFGSSSYVSINMDQGHGVGVLKEKLILDLAEKYKRSPAQMILRWLVQKNVVVIPKTSNVERLKENLMIFDFEITQEDCAAIDSLNRNVRYNDPGLYCKLMHCPYPIYA